MSEVATSTNKQRTIIYIDGFNFYYGSLRKTQYKWVDPLLLCQNMLNASHDFIGLKYFSAKVSNTPDDLSKSTRQQIYYRALKTIPNAEIILGHFSVHHVKMRLVQAIEYDFEVPFSGRTQSRRIEEVEVVKFEEKGSDVNLASEMLIDGFNNAFDVAVLISNDSDLEKPVKHLKSVLKKKVIILNPHEKKSIQLAKQSTFSKDITEEYLKNSLFSDELADAKGKFRKPQSW